MSKTSSRQVTALLTALREGDAAAKDELLTIVYPELRRIAAHYMRQEPPEHTLRTTGLVHEVYVRLFAREMRHILVEHARARNRKKRPEGNVLASLNDVDAAASERTEGSRRS